MLMDNIRWAIYMEQICSIPPDPLLSDDWLEKWLTRLNHREPIASCWLTNQTRDAYYKQGSVCEDYSAIKVPSMLIGGYADGYTNSVKRTFDNIECPKKAILGPWVHLYPHIATPKPLWGFCTEAVKWWDRWLKDAPPSDSSKFVAFIQKDVEVPCPNEVDGRWVENPVSGVETFYLSEGRLGDVKGQSTVEVCSSEVCGHQTITYFPMLPEHIPGDQSSDDKLSCNFETAPFEKAVDYVGRPRVTLCVASDKPIANLYARLCLVDRKERSRMLGYTGVNLNLSQNFSVVQPLEVSKFKKVTFDFDILGESIQPGQRLRLAVSTAYFPQFIPNPEHTTITLDLKECQLDMPVLESSVPLSEDIPAVSDQKLPSFIMRKPASFSRTSEVNELGELTVKTTATSGEKEFTSHGLVTELINEETNTISQNDPLTAKLHAVWKARW